MARCTPRRKSAKRVARGRRLAKKCGFTKAMARGCKRGLDLSKKGDMRKYRRCMGNSVKGRC